MIKIGIIAFFSCSALKTVELPNNLQIIDRQAFLRSGLEHITIPESVRKIGELAFYSDESCALRNVTINSNNIKIEGGAFINSFCLDIIKDMMNHGFSYSQIYKKLRGERILVINHNDSQLMADVTFAQAYSIESENNEQERERGVQEQINNSNQRKKDSDTEQSKSEETSSEKENKDKPYYFQVQNGVLLAYYGYDKDVVIPNSVIEIGIGVFSEKEIKTVTIPDSVVTIDKMAFYHCSHLEKVIDGNGVEKIDDMAFYDCEKLENFIFSEKLRWIGAGAFAYNVLREIHFPDSVLEIGDDAFRGSKNLSEIDIVVESYCLRLGKRAFSSCRELKKISILKFNRIGDYCFENCIALLEFNFKSCSVAAEIGEGAFSRCTSLKQAKLPYGIRRIGSAAFDSCVNLNEIELPLRLEELNTAIFRNCINLYEVELPYHLKKIHARAFEGCTSLEYIYFPNMLQTIGSFSFHNCALREIRIPRAVRKIEERAFSGATENSAMPTVRIDSDRIEIASNAFDYPYTYNRCLNLMKKEKFIKQVMKELNISVVTNYDDDKMLEAILLGKAYSTLWKVRNQASCIIQSVRDDMEERS